MRALSLGAGVQSTTVLLLALDGKIEPFDLHIFADTRDEPQAVYEHLDRLRNVAPITTVTNGPLHATAGSSFVPIPLYRANGMGQRQCTRQFKIAPIYRHMRSLGWQRADLALCISTDEYHRAKDARVQWVRNIFPLLDLGWSRQDCLDYLAERWPYPVPRSACVYCPFRSDREWLEMREHQPDDWTAAVAFDESARQFGYVHHSLRPLASAILRPEDGGQLSLFDECEGMCGL